MSAPLRVLLVEDDAEYAELVELMLGEAGAGTARFQVRRAETLAGGLRELAASPFDAALLDLMLPDSRGVETVGRFRYASGALPAVVLTSLNDEGIALRSIAAGAQDYLVKGRFDSQLLWRSLRYAIERCRLEAARAEIRERRRLDELKDRFVGSVSHELRAPLTIIKGVAANLRDGLAGLLNEKQRELVDMAYQHADRLSRLVGNLLELSRIESGCVRLSTRRVELGRAATHAILGFELDSGRVRVEARVPEDLPDVETDPDLLVQLLVNLIDNGLRFARSRVIVSARTDPGERWVRVTVEDDGPGIPEPRLGDLFQRFSQLGRPAGQGYKGTGLGLALCREIVELHGGRIWAESVPGYGARFHFRLARCGDSASEPRPAACPPPGKFG